MLFSKQETEKVDFHNMPGKFTPSITCPPIYINTFKKRECLFKTATTILHELLRSIFFQVSKNIIFLFSSFDWFPNS